MKFLNFADFVSEKYDPLFESNVTGRAEKAAEVFMKFINKKTNKSFVKFPYPDMFVRDGVQYISYKFYSDKDGSMMRINNPTNQSGLIGSIDFYFASRDESMPDYTFSSPNFPLVKLAHEIADLVAKPKQIRKVVNESAEFSEGEAVNEVRLKLAPDQIREVEKLLAQGKNAKQVREILPAIPYKQILAVKKGTKTSVDQSQEEVQNEMTLQDKILYHQTVMEDVYDITNAIAQKKFNSLMITGRAGTGKTFNVEKALDDNGLVLDRDYFKITGSISVIELFRKLFQYRHQILVFDDADAVFGSDDGRNILKAALDSKEVRRVSYLKKVKGLYDPKDFEDNPDGETEALEAGEIPKTFEFYGRVIFISNLSKDKADPDGAIRSRSILVDVNPDDATLVGVIEKLLPHLHPKDMPLEEKEEVFAFVKNAGDVSMRTFVKAAGFKVAGMKNWKRMADRYI